MKKSEFRSTLDGQADPVVAFLQIDAACDRFETECRAGRSVDLASYLVGVPDEAKSTLFRNLLALDIEYRQRRGDRPDPETYRGQFPGMDAVVDSVFRTWNEQGSFGEARPSDAGRTEEFGSVTEDRVTEQTQEDGTSASSWGEPGLVELGDLESAGYEVRRLLGRGGMGVVYEARQASLNRLVALKLIRSGCFATESELLRFRNEAEAVAQLDHPNVVPIYEITQHRGRHFFSMKLIAGTSLDKRLARFAADPRGAARLVAKVAGAIHHAHQRGILHRDLKPANILLDEAEEPHVTDFGLAKRIEDEGGLSHSKALIGTPSYMAPEQTSGQRGLVSTATDVYGLGTVLYALLAGRAPFVGTTLVETLDMVRTQYPEPPSRLNKLVPRDLELICRKCLEKEPGHRYPSASALAEDLSRWLRGEPIVARPVSRRVRAVMWARRNPTLAATAAAALLFLVSGFAAVTWKWREAVRERARSDGVVALLTRLFDRADSELNTYGRNPTVRDLLDESASGLGGSLDGQPDVEARVRETIGGAYLSLEELPRAEQQIRRAIELDARVNGPNGRTGLHASNLLSTLLDKTGHGEEAERRLRRNLADCRRSLGPDDPISMDAAERLGAVLRHLGRLDEAEAVVRRNVEDRSRVFKPEDYRTLRSVLLLSRILRERRRFDEAEALAYRYAHDIQCSWGSGHPDRIFALTNQGDVERDRGRPDEALRYYRQASAEANRILGPGHPGTLAAEANVRPFGER